MSEVPLQEETGFENSPCSSLVWPWGGTTIGSHFGVDPCPSHFSLSLAGAHGGKDNCTESVVVSLKKQAYSWVRVLEFDTSTRWSTTRSSKVNLPHAINFRTLCGANLVA